MKRVLKTLLLLAVPVPAAAVAVLRLEDPASVRVGIAACALGIAPALVAPLWGRALAAAGAALLALWLAFGPEPWDLLPGRDARWLSEIGTGVDRGLLDFGDQAVPFDPGLRPEMHGLVIAGLFVLVLALGLAVAARRVLAAAALLVAGAGWAATLVERSGELAVGALVLSGALWLVVVERVPAPRRAAAALAAALGVVVLAAGASTSGAVSGDGVLDWRDWNLYPPPGTPVGVEYVWDADYGGIRFPERETTVLRVTAPRRALYWRASTLDTFTADRWIENLYPVAAGAAQSRIEDDPMLPPRAADRSAWVRQEVRVEALHDEHVVGAATPMSIEGDIGRLFYLEGGVAKVPRGLRRGNQYAVRSFVPSPTPQQLIRARPEYPSQATRYVSLDRAGLPLFGEAGRVAEVDRILRDDGYEALWPYRPLWRQAQRLAAGADSSYGATLAVERWLRSGGGFRYEEQPRQARGTPPLADFVTRSREGYCQHFAGSMALMLRLLGIPARVAVGFTSGTWDDGVWRVTDHDAHAWVEAWFEGWGWLPFDPTPGRGTLTATYTLASDSADAVRELGTGLQGLQPDDGATGVDPGAAAATGAVDGRSAAWPALALLGAAGAAVFALALAKLVRRRLRYRGSDPRRLASAARAELADWLLDQGVHLRPGASLREVAGAVEMQLGVSARALVAAVARARYGPPAGAGEAAREARRELRQVLRTLRAELSPRRRLRGFLALRSLGRARETPELGR